MRGKKKSPRPVEIEIGRIGVGLEDDFDVILKPKQRLVGLSIEGYIAQLSASLTSYRKGAELLNAFLHRSGDECFHHRSIADHETALGKEAADAMDAHVRSILVAGGFNPDTGLPVNPALLASSIVDPHLPSISDEQWQRTVDEKVAEYNSSHDEEFHISDIPLSSMPEMSPSETVMISIDDVLTKRQKDTRKEGKKQKSERKNVENTVIYIQADGKAYVLTATTMNVAMRLLAAFLLENHLMENRQLVFFSDGATNIKAALERFFSWRPYRLILDWFHLAKRIRELSSSAFKGTKADKQQIIKTILNHLWPGNVDAAIAYISSLRKLNSKGKPAKDSMVRNDDAHQEMMDYLERKKPFITCHAIRRGFNYRISSNASEKSNDRVVAARQKHNGMSWSFAGGGSLALLTSMLLNHTFYSWITSGRILMSLKDAGWVVNSVRAA